MSLPLGVQRSKTPLTHAEPGNRSQAAHKDRDPIDPCWAQQANQSVDHHYPIPRAEQQRKGPPKGPTAQKAPIPGDDGQHFPPWTQNKPGVCHPHKLKCPPTQGLHPTGPWAAIYQSDPSTHRPRPLGERQATQTLVHTHNHTHNHTRHSHVHPHTAPSPCISLTHTIWS